MQFCSIPDEPSYSTSLNEAYSMARPPISDQLTRMSQSDRSRDQLGRIRRLRSGPANWVNIMSLYYARSDRVGATSDVNLTEECWQMQQVALPKTRMTMPSQSHCSL